VSNTVLSAVILGFTSYLTAALELNIGTPITGSGYL
jgi:hypothetical protein